MIAASGHYASAFVQVLNFTEAEMPVHKVPNGIIVLKVRGLSPDGGVNPHSQTSGFLVLVRKGTNIETECFVYTLSSLLNLSLIYYARCRDTEPVQNYQRTSELW